MMLALQAGANCIEHEYPFWTGNCCCFVLELSASQKLARLELINPPTGEWRASCRPAVQWRREQADFTSNIAGQHV